MKRRDKRTTKNTLKTSPKEEVPPEPDRRSAEASEAAGEAGKGKTAAEKNRPAKKKKPKTAAERSRDAFSIVKALILIAIVVGIPAYVMICHRDVVMNMRSLHDVLQLFRRNQGQSTIIYIGAQILQIVISVLPGQVFQIAAGYIFGFLPGLLLSVFGAALGTTVCYYLARLLGEDAMLLILGEEKSKALVKVLNGERASLITFLIYLIPGLPKDLCCYIAGISRMNFRTFLVISVTGRTPAMCISLAFGIMYLHHWYTGMKIIAVFVGILLLLLLIFRKPLLRLFDRFYRKLTASSGQSGDAENEE